MGWRRRASLPAEAASPARRPSWKCRWGFRRMAATIAIPVCTATSNSAALLCHRRAAHAARPPAPAPLLQGLGRIALPLSAEQAEALRSVAAQAPHGQGAATVVDRSVRRCWQLEPAQVQLGASWQSKVERAVKLAAGGLGLPTQSMQVRTDFVASLTQDMAGCCVCMLQRHACGPLRGLQSARPAPAVAFPCPSCLPSSSLQAELYKVLLYEPGDFFLPHRDTEKAPGMVATLVITLPLVYSGGRLRVRHGGVEKTFGGGSGGLAAAAAAAAGAEAGVAAGAGGGCSYAAFYADCEHEVEPLMAGHRLALAYNLIHVSAAVELSSMSGCCCCFVAASILPFTSLYQHNCLCLLPAAVQVGGGPAPPPPDNSAALGALRGAVESWLGDAQGPQKLCYMLEHQYTQAGITAGLRALKGADRAAAQVRGRLAGSGAQQGRQVKAHALLSRLLGLAAELGQQGAMQSFLLVSLPLPSYCPDLPPPAPAPAAAATAAGGGAAGGRGAAGCPSGNRGEARDGICGGR